MSDSLIIEPVRPGERAALLSLSVKTGLFTEDEAEGLLGGVLDGLTTGALPAGHAAVACRARPEDEALGWCYFAPDPYAERVWNLWWIGVDPHHVGTGAGSALLAHVERLAASSGVRVIVVETSDREPLARARRFYLRNGYQERGRIPDFYSPGEAKVLFSRSLG